MNRILRSTRLHRSTIAATILATVWLVISPVLLAAQQQAPPPGPPPGGPGSAGRVTPAQLQELFESYVMLQAQRQLQLTDQQLPQFIIKLRTLQMARRRADNQRFRILQQLRQLTQGDGALDEGQVRDRLRALDDLETTSASDIKQAQISLDQVLDLRQQARFRMLEEQVERNKVELLMRARQRGGRGNFPQ